MAIFCVRVELYGNPPPDVYERLHVAMAACNLTTEIQDGSGPLYHLPPAEYYGTGAVSIESVRNTAWEAANSVWNDCAVLVSEATQVAWIGLRGLTQ